MVRIERTILANLITNEPFVRKALPFINEKYFHDSSEKIIFQVINQHIREYNTLPTKEVTSIAIQNVENLGEPEYKKATDIVNSLENSKADIDWLVDTTEKFCQDKAIYNAIADSIEIIEGKNKKQTTGALPEILSNALSVTFDPNIGHDYFGQSDDRFEFYHTKETKIPFNLRYFDTITKGGLPNKTLNVAIAGTGVGKSLFMCHLAANYLMQNKNVLYITLEMAEERIAERIDANLMNLDVQSVQELPKSMFDNKIEQVRKETTGKLVVKEYPTASAHKGHFSSLLNELALKKSFKPDAIFIDYLNICASSRMKGMGGAINSYSYIKAIAEELRGLAVEFDLPIFSATQTTRSGYSNSDIGLEDTSESFGLPATADLMFAIISTEELEQQGQFMVKQLKNRYNDPTYNRRFVIGVDRTKMRLYDCEQTAQDDLLDSGQDVEYNEEDKTTKKFAEFKF